jgi:hypothetical protein
VEGLTDEISWILKRDPWPADVPMIMAALREVEGNCPATLNALLRYPLSKRPVDPSSAPRGSRAVRFTIPKSYTDRDYARLAIDGLKDSWGEENVRYRFLRQPKSKALGRHGRSIAGAAEEL